MDNSFMPVQWPAPENIRAVQTTRHGGFSGDGFASFNLSVGVKDNPEHVQKNRQYLEEQLNLPNSPEWIKLVHGARVVDVAKLNGLEEADAIYTNLSQKVLVIPTADCLPVLFCSKDGQEIAAAHAGWRSLAGGVLENTLSMFNCDVKDIHCWFGPAISQNRFEVGEDVLQAFLQVYPDAQSSFKAAEPTKYYANIYQLAQNALNQAGVESVSGGGLCSYDDERFFSYRKQGACSGRMASIIWKN